MNDNPKAPPEFPREEYLAAIAREQELRDFAFFELPTSIASVIDLKPITLRTVLLRLALKCPFLCKAGLPEAEEVVAFLWHLSVDYVSPNRPDSGYARQDFVGRVAQISYAELVAGIDKFIDETFMDAPPSGTSNRVPTASIAATLIDIFAAEYGWDRNQTLDSPIAQLYQLLREIARRKDPKAILFNRLSGKIMAEYGRALEAHNKTKARGK